MSTIAEIMFGIGLFVGIVLSPFMLVYATASIVEDATTLDLLRPLAVFYAGCIAVGVVGAAALYLGGAV